MHSQSSHHRSYDDGHDGYSPSRMQARSSSQVRSSFCIMPHVHGPDRNTSFIFGRSDSRMRPLLNQVQRDRLHCWSMLIALASSAAGTTLLLTAILR